MDLTSMHKPPEDNEINNSQQQECNQQSNSEHTPPAPAPADPDDSSTVVADHTQQHWHQMTNLVDSKYSSASENSFNMKSESNVPASSPIVHGFVQSCETSSPDPNITHDDDSPCGDDNVITETSTSNVTDVISLEIKPNVIGNDVLDVNQKFLVQDNSQNQNVPSTGPGIFQEDSSNLAVEVQMISDLNNDSSAFTNTIGPDLIIMDTSEVENENYQQVNTNEEAIIQEKFAINTTSFSNQNSTVEQVTPDVSSREYQTDPKASPVQESFDSKFLFSPSCSVRCCDAASTEFSRDGEENFLRGCKWCPDGTQVLTNSRDNVLRTFTPLGTGATANKEMTPNCVIKESGLVYDYCWFPLKTDSKPDSCRIACSCPGSPIHLWDSNCGQLVSSYRAMDQCDELTAAYSVSFSNDGDKIYGGYKNTIRIFDTEYSQRRCTIIKTFDSKAKEGQRGIISCFCHGPPESHTFVAGSYSRHVGIYYSLTNRLICLIQGQQGGVTHVMLSPDGRKLYTGGRKDPEIVCWDMRNTGTVLCTFLRDVQTNQRIYFDLSSSGRYLTSGNHDGSVQIWDTQEAGQEVAGETIMKPCYTFLAHRDCVNGVSFNPHHATLATASGQRHFRSFESDSDSDDSGVSQDKDSWDFSLKIWTIPCIS